MSMMGSKEESRCRLCANPRNCLICEKLKRRARTIIDDLDNFSEVLGTYYEPQLLAERFFLECNTVLDSRFADRNAPEIAEYIRTKYRINPIFHAKPRPSYRWLVFSKPE